MSWKTAALVALSVLGVGSLVYLLFHKDEENEDSFLYKSSKIEVKVKIPKECVGFVIGRGGNTIREIEAVSDTTITTVNDSISDDSETFLIRGTPLSIQIAETLIHDIIVRQPLIETCVMDIPLDACGRLIGRGGDNIRMISRSSNAKLFLACLPILSEYERRLTIKGTAEQIALARTLVEQKLKEEIEYRNNLESQLSNRPPRNKHKYLLPPKVVQEKMESYKHREKLRVTGRYVFLPVCVSAMESPDRLWLQMLGPSSVDLDRLNEQMTDFYSEEENKKLHKLRKVEHGQIVAAPFAYDDKWYRAEVLDVKKTSVEEEPEVLLYYVDYGDTCMCKKGNIYELRTDFLRLRFQAIECMLAKIKPRGNAWSEEAIELLGDLTQAGLWKSLNGRIHKYKYRPTKAKREGSPVPCVELFDGRGEKAVNIAEELVERGFAVWTTPTNGGNV